MKSLILSILLIPFLWSTNFESTKPNNVNKQEPNCTDSEISWRNDFRGLWINVDQERPGIAKCKIHYENNQYIVQMWGACKPTACDWGETASEKVSMDVCKFELLWNKVTFAESTITYEMIDGKLKLTNKRHFKDNSGRPDYTLVEYFIKQ